jgi:hypothetical protein
MKHSRKLSPFVIAAVTACAAAAASAAPALAAPTSTIAFEANTGSLWTANPTASLGLGMQPGTSPAITTVGSNYEIAFQANTGSLWTTGSAGTNSWPVQLARTTSPSIANAGRGNIVTAIDAYSTHHLVTVAGGAEKDWNVTLETGTQPSVASNGVSNYAIAFADSADRLEVAYSDGSVHATNYVLKAGRSPSITWRGAFNSTVTGYEIAFVDSAGTLNTLGFTGAGFVPGTRAATPTAGDANPSISSPGDGTYLVAFKNANGNLNTMDQDGSVSGLGLPLSPSSSPSLMTGYGSGSYKIAYQALNGDLSEFSYTVTPGSNCLLGKTCPPQITRTNQDLSLGMYQDTSPSL